MPIVLWPVIVSASDLKRGCTAESMSVVLTTSNKTVMLQILAMCRGNCPILLKGMLLLLQQTFWTWCHHQRSLSRSIQTTKLLMSVILSLLPETQLKVLSPTNFWKDKKRRRQWSRTVVTWIWLMENWRWHSLSQFDGVLSESIWGKSVDDQKAGGQDIWTRCRQPSTLKE